MTRLGVDTGGTFTDFVWLDENGRIHIHKQLSTPHDPAEAILSGIDHLAIPPEAEVVHGSTVATNALLERRGARTALITTAGFTDVLAIGRQNRPDLYALVPQKPPPLVPQRWRFGLHERVTAQGEVLTPLNLAEPGPHPGPISCRRHRIGGRLPPLFLFAPCPRAGDWRLFASGAT
jgi:N-methylhydantoinase A